MDRDSKKGNHALGANMKVTKCVTIRNSGSKCPPDCSSLSPPETWVNCFNVASPTRQALCKPSDWESTNPSHVLLHIDIPNQQLYHLPLLITPVHCIYLVTFDLRNQRESLTRIHSVMKNVYALSSYPTEARGTDQLPPKVLLVGVYADKVADEDRKLFAEKLSEELKKMPYNRLVRKHGGDEPFWAVNGGDVCLTGTDSLSSEIQSHCSRHQVEVHQWIKCHHELQEKVKDPCIMYRDLKSKVASLEWASLRFDQCMKFLHNYGFIFYHAIEEVGEADVVLLRPQYLCELFAEVQELSKSTERVTIADVLSSSAAQIEALHIANENHKQWFQRICIDMGLVFELRSDHVFLMGLEPGPNSPPLDAYSVPPLLVTVKDSNHVAMEGECLLPSHFFAAFVTEILRKLTKPEGKPPRVCNIERHYVQVSIHTNCIHLVEHDFCIEIGLQQVHLRGPKAKLVNVEKTQQLQKVCREIRSAAIESAENILGRLELGKSNICYGFYHSRKTGGSPTNAFGEYLPDEEQGPILQCSCCDPGMHSTTPLHEIWFEKDIPEQEVSVEIVTTENCQIRKLVNQLVSPSIGPPRGLGQLDVQHQKLGSNLTAEQILDHFHGQFVKDMDALAVLFELQRQDIISDGDQRAVTKIDDSNQQNQCLHQCLIKKCNNEALMKVCDIVIAVRGNPKLKSLGNAMKRKLTGPGSS